MDRGYDDTTLTTAAEPMELVADRPPAETGGDYLRRAIMAQLAIRQRVPDAVRAAAVDWTLGLYDGQGGVRQRDAPDGEVAVPMERTPGAGGDFTLGRIASITISEAAPPRAVRMRHIPNIADAIRITITPDGDDLVEIPVLDLRARLYEINQLAGLEYPAVTRILARTDAGETVTIDRAPGAATIEVRVDPPRRAASAWWSCPVGNIDWCAEHRATEGVRGEDYARVASSFWAFSGSSDQAVEQMRADIAAATPRMALGRITDDDAPEPRGGREASRRERKRRAK